MAASDVISHIDSNKKTSFQSRKTKRLILSDSEEENDVHSKDTQQKHGSVKESSSKESSSSKTSMENEVGKIDSGLNTNSTHESNEKDESRRNDFGTKSPKNSKKNISNIDSDSDDDSVVNTNSMQESKHENELSDNEMHFKTSKKKKKRVVKIDSDSDTDSLSNTNISQAKDENESSDRELSADETSSLTNISKKKRRIVKNIDSDSDDQSENIEDVNRSQDRSQEIRNSAARDSDDSNSGEVKSKREVASKKKFKDILYNKLHKKKSKKKDKEETKLKSKPVPRNKSGSSDSGNSENESKISENQFANKDLYDAESSEEERPNTSFQSDDDSERTAAPVIHKDKKKKKSHQKPAQRKSSAEALEKIHAEAQRLIRERSVSLPYFLPKPISITEFLQRRKPIPAIPLRAKGESLKPLINLYEERMKSNIEYIQHVSDSDNEETEDNSNNKENTIINSVQNSETNMEVDSTRPKSNLDNTQVEVKNVTDKLGQSNDSQTNEDMEHFKDIDLSGGVTSKVDEDDGDETKCDKTVENSVVLAAVGNIEDEHIENKSILQEPNEISRESDCEMGDDNIESDSKLESKNSSENIKDLIENQDCSKTNIDGDSCHVKTNVGQCCNTKSSEENSSSTLVEQTEQDLLEVITDASQQLNEIQNKSTQSKALIDSQLTLNKNKATLKPIQNSTESQQNSDIFSSLMDSEFLNEKEYSGELCDDSGVVTHLNQDPTQNRPPVKKKLFSDWSNTDNDKPKSTDEEVITDKLEVTSDKRDLIELTMGPIHLKPLSGKDDGFIELVDYGKCASNLKPGVLKLMQRFSRHAATKVAKPKPANQTVSLNITTTERDSQGEITGYVSEALSIVLQDDSEHAMSKHGANSKPGAKLLRLKEQLDREMTKKREEAWKRRIEEAKMDEEMYEGEKSECEADYDEFDENENETEDITTEEDEEIDDVREKPKKKRVKSVFLDEEAEVSGDEEGEDDEMEDQEEDEEKEDHKEKEESKEVEEYPRSLKTKTKTFDMFATQRNEDGMEDDADDEDDLPGYQVGMRSTASTPAPDKVVFSPVLTLSCCDKSYAKNRDASFSLEDTQPISSHPTSTQHPQAKKLDFDSLESELDQPTGLDNLLPTQPSSRLEDLFSGQFTSQPIDAKDLEANDEPCQFVTETQMPNGIAHLLGPAYTPSVANLCSGAFSSQPVDAKQLEADDGTCGQFMTSASRGTEEGRSDEVHRLSLNKSSILSSDEEDDLVTSVARKKMNRVPKRVVYSDDEDEVGNALGRDHNETDDGNSEEDDGENEVEVDKESEIDNGEEDDEVEYDSEENEVVKKVDEFFEAEAELSESEWDSEDENENEMDRMEQEEADNEYHDEEQLKEELGKIHMKQVLDDDNREVKMLQEILLEDGELHSDGPGRQRQFKWSNLDDNSDMRITAALSGDSEGEEEGGGENEEQEAWRKARLEREQYLESQKDKLELAEAIQEESLHHAELAKTVILNDIKTKATRPEPQLPLSSNGLPTKSPDSKLHALMGLHKKRGSYLARGNQSLVRLAKITSSVPDDDGNIVKKKGNFVFSAVDPVPEEVKGNNQPDPPTPNRKVQVKRKKSLATPQLLKKLKMHDGGKASVLSKLIQSNDF